MSPTGTYGLSKPAWIVGAEVCTPVGIDAATTEGETSAGTVPFAETEENGIDGEPVRASRLALLDAGASRTERMKALAATAFRSHLEVTAGLNLWARAAALPMVLALPEPDAGAGEVRPLELERALESVAAALLPRNHLRAFEAWGKPALAFARTEGLSSEYDDDRVRGAVLALASVGSAEEDWPAVRNALESLAEEQAEARISAWIDGMKLARGEHVGSRLEPLLGSQRSEVRAAVAEIIGYRRQGRPEVLAKQLERLFEQQTARPGPTPPAPRQPELRRASAMAEMEALGMALARMRCTSARPLLEKALAAAATQSLSPELLFAAASLGSAWALDVARRAISESPDGVEPDLYVVLALGSEERDAGLLESLQRKLPEDGRRKQALCTAMGILGAPEFIPGLIERLEKEKEDGVRFAAAEALQRITGAGLRETVPEPPDELADLEPSDSDPDPEDSAEENADATPGDEEKRRVVERTSTDPQAWAKWWAEHRRAFSAGKRIRLGRPFQLEVCVDEAAAASSPQQTRALAMRELAMRSAGQNVECGGCEPDWYVEQQMRALSSWRGWCSANGRTGKNRR